MKEKYIIGLGCSWTQGEGGYPQEVVDAHINLYVNKFSISLGFEGREAVEKVFGNTVYKENIFL